MDDYVFGQLNMIDLCLLRHQLGGSGNELLHQLISKLVKTYNIERKYWKYQIPANSFKTKLGQVIHTVLISAHFFYLPCNRCLEHRHSLVTFKCHTHISQQWISTYKYLFLKTKCNYTYKIFVVRLLTQLFITRNEFRVAMCIYFLF